MQGLLDLLDKPAVQGLLAAGLGAAASAGRGRGLLGNLGAGGLMGLQAYSGAQQNQLAAADRAKMTEYRDIQMQNLQAEMEQRKKKQALIDGLLGGASQPAQPGQLGSGSFGVVPTAGGAPAIPQPQARIPNLSFDQLAALKMHGVDLTELHKYANDPMKMEAGSTYVNRVTGQREYMPKLPEGATVSGGRVGAMPGYMDLLAQTTLAQQAPKTMLDAAGRINLRPNADGTQSPVSELSENTTLQNVLGGVLGRPVQPSAGPMQAPASRPQAASQPGRPVISPVDQKGADAESIRMIQDELKNPNLSPADKAALQREVQRLTVAQGQSGFPTPTLVRPGVGYGKTTAQTIAEEADRTRQIEQAKADVIPAADRAKNDQRQAGNIAKADSVLNEIRDAKKLVGWNTAGVLGTLSVLPATEARDLSAKLQAVKANLGFDELQKMREQSPTGGALGGVAIQELVALQSTVASLDQLQSPAQLGKALDKIEKHYTAWQEAVRQARSGTGGASGGWGIREKK